MTDILVAGLLESKAFSLFSFVFGVGLAIQAERAELRGIGATHFLARRLLILLALGLFHMVAIWNGDILVLHSVCGLLVLPLRRLPPRVLLSAGAAMFVLPVLVNLPIPFPSAAHMISQASRATKVYGAGGFTEILVFRWQETGPFILPLLLSVVPYAAGLMLWGVAAWRSGVLREPGRHRRLLLSILSLGGMAGVIATGVKIFASSTGRRTGVPSLFLEIGSPVPLAMAYGAAVLLWLTPERVATVAAPFAAAGRMAFTNYLTQSVILGLIFYGYGFGLFGRIGSAAGAALGIGIYAAQLYLSRLWLRRYRFGPAEWLWRSLTYGRRQPMRAHRS